MQLIRIGISKSFVINLGKYQISLGSVRLIRQHNFPIQHPRCPQSPRFRPMIRRPENPTNQNSPKKKATNAIPFDSIKRSACKIHNTANWPRNKAHDALAHAFEEPAHALITRALKRFGNNAGNAMHDPHDDITATLCERVVQIARTVLLLKSLLLIVLVHAQRGQALAQGACDAAKGARSAADSVTEEALHAQTETFCKFPRALDHSLEWFVKERFDAFANPGYKAEGISDYIQSQKNYINLS